MPKFAVLFPADDEQAWAAASPDAREETYDTDMAFAQALKAHGGTITGGAAFRASSATRTLSRAADDSVTVSEGPSRASAEQLSGFFLVTCDSEEILVEAARKLVRAHPVVEIRPLDD